MLRFVERSLVAAGVIALAVFIAGYVTPRVQATQAMTQFEASANSTTVPPEDSGGFVNLDVEPDMSDWSQERIDAWNDHPLPDSTDVLGVLHIDSVGVAAPVYTGTSERVLDLGIGWIEGTSGVNGAGNIGLAAHRDGFFRGLKDIAAGDTIRLSTRLGERLYTVTDTQIVKPRDVQVLAQTGESKLTLVTCHPFYFVGSAPNRFIVQAIAVD